MGVASTGQLKKIIRRIGFAPSCVDLQWEFDIEEVSVRGPDKEGMGSRSITDGWFVRTSFVRPETGSGVVGKGYGRREFIQMGASEDSVIKTCWLLVELVVRHELMEAFLVDGKRIFDPHASLDMLMQGKTENQHTRWIGGEAV